MKKKMLSMSKQATVLAMLLFTLFCSSSAQQNRTVPGTAASLKARAQTIANGTTPDVGPTGLQQYYSATGHYTLSVDGIGSTESSMNIRVNKPNALATVQKAILISTVTTFSGVGVSCVTIAGSPVTWEGSVTTTPPFVTFSNYWADVTSIVASQINAFPAGISTLPIIECASDITDGEALLVVFNDASATEKTVIVMLGGQNPTGDNFPITLAQPIDPNKPGALLDMGLGIGFSYQGDGVQQFSEVSVNGTRLTSAAGGDDDGQGANGALITVGGIGDLNTNPTDPMAPPTTDRSDDELYNILPFITNATTSLNINTTNPSLDDNIFLAYFTLSGAAIVGEGILLSQTTSSGNIGTMHTVKASVLNTLGQPIDNRLVTFTITSGPNAGGTFSTNTNASGEAFYTYTGSGGPGTDVIKACFTNSLSVVSCSNNVSFQWLSEVITECAPVTSRLYVDGSVTTSGTGGGWVCAIKELSTAIAMANVTPSITSIWVADGTYKPAPAGRFSRFNITRANLTILGGFAGGEALATDANPAVNATILSGDVGTIDDNSDNAYQIIRIPSLPANQGALVIDGVIVEKGNANGPGDGNGGAGLFAYSVPASTPILIKRTTFRNNMATGLGGAVNLNGASITFDGCRFATNSAVAGGGAYYSFSSSSNFNNSVFSGNSSLNVGGACYGNIGNILMNKSVFTGNTSAYAGAVYQNKLGVSYVNCVFNANIASQQGGALFVHNTSLANIVNSTFFKNNATSNGGAILLNLGGYTHTANSIFWSNTINNGPSAFADIANSTIGANTYANNMFQAGASVPADNGTTIVNNMRGINPMFVNEASVLGADLKWATADDGLELTDGSPAKNAGNNALNSESTDITNNTRVICAMIDMGAYENQTCIMPAFTEMVDQPFVMAGMATTTATTGVVANPFKSDLQIRYMGTEKAGIAVVSASGKTMSVVGNVKEGITHIDASSWSAGMYQAVITTASGKRMNFKVVKL